MFDRFFSKAPQLDGADGVWPKASILDVLGARFGAVEPIDSDGTFHIYGVVERQLRFVVILVSVPGAPESIAEIGFMAQFAGYEITDTAIEAMNRNLHLSVVSRKDGEADAVFVVGGVRLSGEFEAGLLNQVLDVWRRDLMVVVQEMAGVTLMSAMPALQTDAALKFAMNNAPAIERPPEATNHGAPADLIDRPARADALQGMDANALFASFVSGADRALCSACEGRGRTGFIARRCDDCDGSGFVRCNHEPAG